MGGNSNILVIFGATGDLTHRKLIPALYHLLKSGELPEGFAVVAFARRPYTNETYKAEMVENLQKYIGSVDYKIWKKLSSIIYYFQSQFDEDQNYPKLKEFLTELDSKHNTQGNRVFYLATPPENFSEIASRLKKFGLAETDSKKPWHRVVFEKPFGNDLRSAMELNQNLSYVFSENQIYRIDHFLGKELVQNVIVLRFANGLFEPLWNRKYVDHVQITASETIGVGSRGGYYETSGALKDMVQNHLLQLLALVAMEAPLTLSPNDIQEEKVKVMRALKPIRPEEIESVRGQYSKGEVNSEKVPGYLEEEKVPQSSETETYVALKVEVQNGKWQGVPFYLRTGKRMKMDAMEIVMQFRATPYPIFQDIAMESNRLVIRIQPEEGISFVFNAKVPGTELKLQPVNMDFSHAAAFGPNTPEAYERLLHDVMEGDPTLFTRWDEVEHAWEFIDRVTESWKGKKNLYVYQAGSMGPKEADEMLSKAGHRWAEPLSTKLK